ncbi:hypothetical protein GCM10007937_44860 [Mesorhizobium albiziae]|nr:hypothetical protein GCM10007937_44860 [Mesorhizobium albiziae]
MTVRDAKQIAARLYRNDRKHRAREFAIAFARAYKLAPVQACEKACDGILRIFNQWIDANETTSRLQAIPHVAHQALGRDVIEMMENSEGDYHVKARYPLVTE